MLHFCSSLFLLLGFCLIRFPISTIRFSWFCNVSLCFLLRLYVSICFPVSFFVPLVLLFFFLLQSIVFSLCLRVFPLVFLRLFAFFFKLKSFLAQTGRLVCWFFWTSGSLSDSCSFSHLDVRINFMAIGEKSRSFRVQKQGSESDPDSGGKIGVT